MQKYWFPIEVCKALMKEGHNDLTIKVKIEPVESVFQNICAFKNLSIENICKCCSRYYNIQNIVDAPEETDEVTNF